MAVLPPDPLFVLRSDMGHIHSICFVENAENSTETLLAATENGMVYFWDLERNRLKCKQSMGESIQTIHYYNGNVVIQEKKGLITLWSLDEVESKYQPKKTYECAGGFCKCLRSGNELIVPQEDCTLDVINLEDMELVQRFHHDEENFGQAMCIQKVAIGTKIYVLGGYESGDILLWDYAEKNVVSHLKLRECITSITFDTVTSRGICGNASNVLQIFSIDKEFNICLKCEITCTNEGCNVVKLRGDRKIFVAGGWDGRLRLFSWKSLRLLAVLNEHRGQISDVQFSDGIVKIWGSKILAAASADGVISLWSLYN